MIDYKLQSSLNNSPAMRSWLWISLLMLLGLLTAGCVASDQGAQDASGASIPAPAISTTSSAAEKASQTPGCECGCDSTVFSEVGTPEPLAGRPLPRLAPTASPVMVTAITVENVRFIEPIALPSREDGVFRFQDDGDSLAVSNDHRTKIYGAPKFYERQALSHNAMVRMLAFGPEDSTLATLEGPEANGQAIIWDIRDRQSLASLNHVWGVMGWLKKSAALLAVTRTPSGEGALTRLTPRGEMTTVMRVNAKLLATSEDGRYVLLQNGELWDVMQGQLMHQAPRLQAGFLVTPGPSLLFLKEDGEWGVWRKGEKAFFLDPDIDMALLDPSGKTLVFVQRAENDVLLVQKSLNDDEERILWRGRGGRITAMAFHPQGRLLAVATAEPKDAPQIRWWDLATGQALGESSAFQYEVSHMVFSPDGRRLATGGEDGVLIWGVAAQ